VAYVETPLHQLEHALHPWVTVVIMPLFALANAGIALDSNFGSMLMSPVAMGVCLGLLIGKPAGILLATWIATRWGWASFPSGVSWPQLAAVGVLAGIGFTMSLFIAELAFSHDSSLIPAKVGILVGSTIAGLTGWLLLKRFTTT
jgi:NhaA family Na+:H+ antiporter